MGKKNRQSNEAKKATTDNPLGWIVFAALGVMLLWSCRVFLDYGGLWSKLSGKPLVERGRIGSSEYASFLARSGRASMQSSIAETAQQVDKMLAQARMAGQDHLVVPSNSGTVEVRSLDDLPSRVADGWAWVAAKTEALPLDAKIYLNCDLRSPEGQRTLWSLYYYYGSTLWYPRHVEVSAKPVGVRDDQTLLENAVFVNESQYEKLRESGFTHIVITTPRGMMLRDLRPADATGGAKP